MTVDISRPEPMRELPGSTGPVPAVTPPGGLRGVGFGRGGPNSLAERKEAAQRRLSSSLRAGELVDCALRAFDEQLTERGLPDADEILRGTVRTLLTLAYATPRYDVTVVPAEDEIAVRVRYSVFGPEAEVIDLASASAPPSPAPVDVPAAPVPPAAPDADGPGPAVAPVTPPAGASAVSPWWTPELQH